MIAALTVTLSIWFIENVSVFKCSSNGSEIVDYTSGDILQGAILCIGLLLTSIFFITGCAAGALLYKDRAVLFIQILSSVFQINCLASLMVIVVGFSKAFLVYTAPMDHELSTYILVSFCSGFPKAMYLLFVAFTALVLKLTLELKEKSANHRVHSIAGSARSE